MASSRRLDGMPSSEAMANVQNLDVCSVLVTDDDEDLCTSLQDVLELRGHAVDLAHSGLEARQACSRRAYDLLLLDVSLPDISGLELISQLEEIRPELEILVITGHASLDSAVHAVSRSTIGYLIKPIDLDRLLGILERVGERRRLERDNLRLLREREELIEQLENKNTELERYTYTVSHDLKSPLITISGFLGHAQKSARAANWDHFDSDLGRITNAVQKMRDLLDELLELSRIGRIANPSEEVAITELAHEVAELVSGQALEKGVEIVIADDMPVARGDRVRLRGVLQNLVDNAIKFMGDQRQPRVEIGARTDGDVPVFFVADNGIGIEADRHHDVFGLFEKGASSSAGSGIGLALVKRIVEFHGGTIWIDSMGQGKGATVCFTLGPSDPVAALE